MFDIQLVSYCDLFCSIFTLLITVDQIFQKVSAIRPKFVYNHSSSLLLRSNSPHCKAMFKLLLQLNNTAEYELEFLYISEACVVKKKTVFIFSVAGRKFDMFCYAN